MALTLLDGTTASIDLTIAPTANGSQASVKCYASYVSLMFQRGSTEKLTFCSGGWSEPILGIRRGMMHIDGFTSTGAAISDPLIYFGQNDPLPFTFTADTGSTLTGFIMQTQEALGARAMAEFSRGQDFLTHDAVTSVWVEA